MTVLIIKKLKYYTIIEYNNITYNIENEVVYKYNLKHNADISVDVFKEVITINEYYYFDRISKNKLRKLLTEYELRVFLEKNEAKKALIDELIEKYKTYQYINDNNYVNEYVKSKQFSEGKQLIKQKLLQKGINETTINDKINEIDETPAITNIVVKRMKQLLKYNKEQVKNKLQTYLISKGFNHSQVIKVINENMIYFHVDEKPLIEKEYKKLYLKNKSKKQGNELKYYIKNKLIQKGFNITDIEQVINELMS